MSITRLFLEFSEKKFNRLARFFKDHRFTIQADERIQKYYVGSGVAGSVYMSPKYPDVVVRIGYVMEEDGYEEVKDKDFENVVDVKFHRQLRGRSYITVMEKLESIGDDLYSTINSVKIRYEDNIINEYLKSHEFYERSLEDLEGIKEAYDMTVAIDPKGYNVVDWDLLIKYLEDVNNGMNELLSVGMRHQDLHGGNIMYDPKTDNYKLIDLA